MPEYNFNRDALNDIMGDYGLAGNRRFEIDAYNAWAIGLGGSGGHRFTINALNEIVGLIGGDGAPYRFNIDALNEISRVLGGESNFRFVEDVLSEISDLPVFGDGVIQLSGPKTIAENSAAGTNVGTLSVNGGSGSYTFSLTDSAGNRFAVDGTALEGGATATDFETAASHSITVEADNGVDPPLTRAFTINVTDVVVESGPEASVLTVTSGATDNEPNFEVNFASGFGDHRDVAPDDFNDVEVQINQAGSYQNYFTETLPDPIDDPGNVSGVATLADGTHNYRQRTRRTGAVSSSYSNIVEHTIDTTGPVIQSLAVTSSPAVGDTYGVGEDIEITVTWNEDVEVTGTPQLTLNIGGASEVADYDSGDGTDELVFIYTVQSGDEDTDGISIGANSLALNSGTLKDAATNNATLTHSALTTQTGHKVDATGVAGPDTITGLWQWVKADAGVFSDAGTTPATNGGTVQQWSDQSGNNRHLSQGTAGDRPTYHTGVVNSLPVVRGDGGSAGNYLSGPDMSGLTEGEAFIVIKCAADPAADTNDTYLWEVGTAGQSGHFAFDGDNTIYDGWGTDSRKTVGDPTPSLSSSFRLYNVSSETNDWTARLDGTQIFNTGTNGAHWSATTTLFKSVSATGRFKGDIAEMIVYDNVLSSGDRNVVEAYIADKYGLTIA